MDGREANTAKGSGRMPPYVSFRTFKTFMQDLHEHDIPQKIDKHVLRRFSGTVGNQLMTALRFLDFIDGDERPTDNLRALSRAFQTPEWNAGLGEMLRSQYAAVFSEVDLATTTPPQVHKAFRSAYGGNDAVLKKSETFFLQAAKEAEIPISKRITIVSRQPVTGPRKRSGSRAEDEASDTDEGSIATESGQKRPKRDAQGRAGAQPNPQTKNNERSVYDVLLSVWEPGRMPKDVDDAIITVMRWLKQQELEAAKPS